MGIPALLARFVAINRIWTSPKPNTPICPKMAKYRPEVAPMAPQHAEGADIMRKFVIVAATIVVMTGLAGCDRHHQNKEAAVQVVQAPVPDCNCDAATEKAQSEETLTRLTPSRYARHHSRHIHRQARHQAIERYAASYSSRQERDSETAPRGHYPPPPPPPRHFQDRSYDGPHEVYSQRRSRVWMDGFGKRHFITAGYSRAARNAASMSVNSYDANNPWAHYDEDCDY